MENKQNISLFKKMEKWPQIFTSFTSRCVKFENQNRIKMNNVHSNTFHVAGQSPKVIRVNVTRNVKVTCRMHFYVFYCIFVLKARFALTILVRLKLLKPHQFTAKKSSNIKRTMEYLYLDCWLPS